MFLLKKLPGVQVDKDGNVTAQGEQVQKVYVDGKEFFGNDPKMATRADSLKLCCSIRNRRTAGGWTSGSSVLRSS